MGLSYGYAKSHRLAENLGAASVALSSDELRRIGEVHAAMKRPRRFVKLRFTGPCECASFAMPPRGLHSGHEKDTHASSRTALERRLTEM